MKKYNLKLRLFIFLILTLLFSQLIILNNTKGSNSDISVVFGETYSGSIDSAAEMDTYTFSANSGDVLFVRMNRLSTTFIPLLKLYAPNGSLLLERSPHLYYSILEYTLPVSGDYQILAGDEHGTGTGNYNIFFQKINNPGNVTSTEFGETYNGSISTAAEMDTYIMTASMGDKVLVRLNRVTGDFIPMIWFYAPNGSELFQEGDTIYETSFEYSIPVSGEYKLLVYDRDGAATGNYTLFFQKLSNPVNITFIEFGETYNSKISKAAEMDSYLITVNTGDVIFIRMNRLSNIIPELSLYAPNGSLLLHIGTHLYYSTFDYVIPISGNYLVLAKDRDGNRIGEYNIFFQRLNNPSNFTSVEFGETYNGSLTQAAEMDTFVFLANMGDSIFVRLNRVTGDFIPMIWFYAPNGSELFQEGDTIYETSFEYSIPVSGEYKLLVYDRDGASTGNFSIYFQKTGSGVETPDKDTKEETEETEIIPKNLPVTEVVVISTAIASFSLIGIIAGTSLGKYKFLSFLSLFGPLYLRTVREDVFDNQKRLSMYNHIAENQPVVYSNVKKSCNLSHGEINWHANIMEQLGLIRVERKGFNVFFKIAGERLPPEKFIRLTDTQKNIFDIISNKPGITQNEIVEKLKIKQQNISYNILKLEEKNQIRLEKKGKIKHYYPIKKDVSSA